MQRHDSTPTPQPWWRHGHVWLVISGPAIVVVAGIATLVIAARGADPLVAKDYYRRGIEINQPKTPATLAIEHLSRADVGAYVLRQDGIATHSLNLIFCDHEVSTVRGLRPVAQFGESCPQGA